MAKKSVSLILMASLLMGCTTTNDFYTFDENDEFSLGNTLMASVGVLAIVGIAASGGGGGTNNYSSTPSCSGNYCQYDSAWDYLPGSGEYRCRSTTSGQFVSSNNCSWQQKTDNWS